LDSCMSGTCQDGLVQEGIEECDDGNGINDDECSNQCMFAQCGDGIVQASLGEQCDDGNLSNTDACLDGVGSTCQFAQCGDGFINISVETCDDGNLIDTDACTSACLVATCGDGILRDGVEECDDGNVDHTDSCSNNCRIAVCGDGIVQSNEQCDDGNQNDQDACLDGISGLCTIAICGDGIVRSNVEECDDGNVDHLDLCSNFCVRARCGDGVVQSNEQCDDGNQINQDNCSNFCTSAQCGDGIIQVGEQCDDRNLLEGDGCNPSCQNETPIYPITWRQIPMGSYLRGSREVSNQQPVLLVNIPAFLLSRAELTVSQYRQCVDARVCSAPAIGIGCNWNVVGKENHPVNCITWFQAKTYVTWLDAQMPSNYQVRLPSESEWEYAARSQGLFAKFSWANVTTASCAQMNFLESRIAGCNTNSTMKVCSFSTTQSPIADLLMVNGDSLQGVCDLNGNIAEWVEDAYLSSYQTVPNDGSANQPAVSSNNLLKVIRGGSWKHNLSSSNSLIRSGLNRSSQAPYLGMRTAATCTLVDAVEICGNAIDENCDGKLNEGCP
jgi:cysteine-rich repeat protein